MWVVFLFFLYLSVDYFRMNSCLNEVSRALFSVKKENVVASLLKGQLKVETRFQGHRVAG